MTLVPWDPFKNLITLQERMNRLFEETVQRGREQEPLTKGAWMPPVDIYETDDEIVLLVEIPGMDQKDVDIQVNDNTLTLKGERVMAGPVKEENYHRVERAYGPFTRSFTLPSTVDQENISATYNRGILEIKLPKSSKSKPQQIKITVQG